MFDLTNCHFHILTASSVLIPSNNLPICTFIPFSNRSICCWAHLRLMHPLLDASIFVCLTLEPLYDVWVYCLLHYCLRCSSFAFLDMQRLRSQRTYSYFSTWGSSKGKVSVILPSPLLSLSLNYKFMCSSKLNKLVCS